MFIQKFRQCLAQEGKKLLQKAKLEGARSWPRSGPYLQVFVKIYYENVLILRAPVDKDVPPGPGG